MTTVRPTSTCTTARHFVRHYLEMVAAMVVGMVLLGPIWSLAVDAAGAPTLLARSEHRALVMATNMTIAMSAWMRYRGHAGPPPPRWPRTVWSRPAGSVFGRRRCNPVEGDRHGWDLVLGGQLVALRVPAVVGLQTQAA